MVERKSLWERPPLPLDRKDLLRILEKQNEEACRELASRTDTPAEVLYYLATEASPTIRRIAAANPATPPLANLHLTEDRDEDVRVQLARKIGQLLPNMPADTSRRMRELTIETLERLARDALPRVRAVLAEEIKLLDCVPRRVIKALARDIEEVAAPILEYSPLLSDADLLEIISSAQAGFALLAIAKRKPLRANVAETIAMALDVPAVAALLLNSGAQIRSRTLEKLVDQASKVTDWHQPLVLRDDLSQRAIRRIASFVSKSLIETLARRHGLDEKTRRHLKDQMNRHIEAGDCASPNVPAPGKPPDLIALKRAGKLDDAFVENAAEEGSRQLVVAVLALLAGTSSDTASRVLESGSAKAVTALVWRAGLSMRAAFKIQTLLLKLPAWELLPARDGVRFPMTEEEMRWHLRYFKILV